MRYSVYFLILFAFLVSGCVEGKVFVGQGNDKIYESLQTDDGGYISAGSTQTGEYISKAWLIKADSKGNKIWEKTFGKPGGYTYARTVNLLTYGGYILGGYTNDSYANTYSWLLKTDGRGNIVWEKKYIGSGVKKVLETDDGGFVLLSDLGEKIYLIKINDSGNQIWEKTYSFSESLTYACDLLMTSDGGYAIAGNTLSYEKQGWLLKTDGNGNEIWKYDTDYSLTLKKCQETGDGFIMAGSADTASGSNDVLMIKIGSDGTFKWQKTFGGNDMDFSTFTSVCLTGDGGYLVAGVTESKGKGSTDAWVIKTNADGIVVWDKTYGGAYTDGAYSVHSTSDGGYIIGGVVNPLNTSNNEGWLLKIDKNGKAGF
jgi:hypothetical protein